MFLGLALSPFTLRTFSGFGIILQIQATVWLGKLVWPPVALPLLFPCSSWMLSYFNCAYVIHWAVGSCWGCQCHVSGQLLLSRHLAITLGLVCEREPRFTLHWNLQNGLRFLYISVPQTDARKEQVPAQPIFPWFALPFHPLFPLSKLSSTSLGWL